MIHVIFYLKEVFMKVGSYVFVFFIIFLFLCPILAFSSEIPKIGVRGGLGTDINLGLAFGVGGNYLLDMGGSPLELGALLYYSHSTETSNNGYNDYHETTDITVFGMLANYLMGYELGTPGIFLLAGFGLGAISVYWEEWSPTDGSLGESLPDYPDGSRMEDDGVAAGSVFNLGGGMAFSNGADIRFEIPVILVFGEYGEASTVVPTFTITAGMRF
jgi:hypothetical protein